MITHHNVSNKNTYLIKNESFLLTIIAANIKFFKGILTIVIIIGK